MNIFGIDLKIDNNNYSSFSGWFISKNSINQNQIDSLTNFLNDNNQNLNLKSFDSEGEDLEDYCDDFEYFDLEIDENDKRLNEFFKIVKFNLTDHQFIFNTIQEIENEKTQDELYDLFLNC